MTGPKPVDISSLLNANTLSLMKLETHEALAEIQKIHGRQWEPGLDKASATSALTGSDLKFDEKSGQVVLNANDQKAISILEDYVTVRVLIQAAGDDKQIDEAEARAYLKKIGYDKINPSTWMKTTQEHINARWKPIGENLKLISDSRNITSLERSLTEYNNGIYLEEKRLARRSFSPVKFGLNILTIGRAPVDALGIYNPDPMKVYDPTTGKIEEEDYYSLWGDDAAAKEAFNNFTNRAKAIAGFRKFIRAELKKDSAGTNALTADEILGKLKAAGDITIMVKGVEENISGEVVAEILEDKLAFKGLHDIATTKELKARFDKIIAFAEEERPGMMGFRGGNTGHRDWFYNITGVTNNLAFARASLSFVERTSKDPQQQDKARAILEASQGNGGTFANLASVGATNLLCGFDTWCTPTKYDPWSDEDSIDSSERFVRNGLLVLTAYKGMRYARENQLVGRFAKWTAGTRIGRGLGALGRGAWKYTGKRPTDAFLKWYRAVKQNSSAVRTSANLAGKGTALMKKVQQSPWMDAFIAAALTGLLDTQISPANSDTIFSRTTDEFDLRPIPLQDVAAIDPKDEFLKKRAGLSKKQ